MNTETQRPTPETSRFMDSLHGYSDSWEQFAQKVEDFSSKLERERDEAREQLEREQMRLVACDAVAMADTESSRGPARDMHTDYWSAAVESVIRRVDECIELRRQNEALQAELADIRQRLKGHADSKLDGENGLASATMRGFDQLQAENEAMREAIKEAAYVLDQCATWPSRCDFSDSANFALAKLQPFLKPFSNLYDPHPRPRTHDAGSMRAGCQSHQNRKAGSG